MANKKALIWIAIASTVLIGGGIAWWAYSKNKNKDLSGGKINRDKATGEIIDTKKDEDGKPLSTTPTPPSGGSNTYTPPPPSVDNPFKSATDIKAFQDWLDKVHPNWINNGGGLHGGGGYGSFGSKTQKAWSDYGTEYNTASAPVVIAGGTKLYIPKSGYVLLYSYPSADKQYGVQYITQADFLTNPFAQYIENTGTGWAKVAYMPSWNLAKNPTSVMLSYAKKYPNGFAVYIQNKDLNTSKY